MQRMIRQFAAEYTSKTSSTQDSSSPNSTKNQSLLKVSPVASSTAGARAQNPVLSKLLMADQDSPLDLTVRKSQLDPSEQDGVLDLSTKKSPCAGNASLSHSPGCSATPGNGEETAEAVAIDSLGQPKSPLEKITVRLCAYHQKHFVRVLSDICTEVQTGYEGQQLSGPEIMDVSTCSSGCSQYHIENQERGTSCPESKLPLLLDAEQSEARGSLRILCHALQHAVELKSTDRRENCSSIVRRDFPELPVVRTTSISPRDSLTQGYLTASNAHHSIKNLEGQTSTTEQEMGVRKSEDDKDQVQSRGLLGGYAPVKATNVNMNEEISENRVGSLKNPFKAFPEETREPAFTTSSPRRADKENALQCSSKTSVHQDPEINDQETRSKVENHYLTSGKSKGGCHMHPGDKTHVENAKDIWLPINSMPAVQHKATNGHSRAKSISASTKSTRKSKKSSGLRINDYDNQYDVVYISQPITECHYESKKTVSARKTARKSTRGYYYNGECCELPTIRTLVKSPYLQENGNILATRPEVLTSPIQSISLPSSSYLAAAEPAGSNDDQRSSTVAPSQEDSFGEIRPEQCAYESISSEVTVLKQREASLAEEPTTPASLLPCPVFHPDKDSLFVSSLQAMTVSFPQQNEGDLQDSTDTLEAPISSESCNYNRCKENIDSIADSVIHSVSEAANDKTASLLLGNGAILEPPILIEPEPHVSMNLLIPEVSANSMDLLPPLDEPASVIDVSPSIEPPLLSPVDLAEPSVVPPAPDDLEPCMTFPAEIPYIPSSASPVQPVASPRSISPVIHPAGEVPELPAHLDLEPSETLSAESSAVAAIKMDEELPQLLSDLEAAKLPLSLDGTTTHETGVENSQNLKEGLSAESESVLPLVDTNEDKGEKNINDTINTSKTTKFDEEMEANSETSIELKISENDKKETSSKTNIDKKRRREKKSHIVSDRCLRSQQSLAPAEDTSGQPCSSSSLQFPQLQIKLSKSPGAKRFKREVHLDGATSVCFPNDRLHHTLLNDSSKSIEQQADEGNDITIRQAYKKLMAKESVIEESQNEEDNKDETATKLEICLEANSDKRSVHVPTATADKTEKQVDLKPESLENSDSPMNIIEVLSKQHEKSSITCPGSKHAQPVKTMKCKKPALQFYNLRHTPTIAHVVTATKNTSEKVIVQANSDITTTSADSVVTDEPNARNENSNGFDSLKILSDNKPRFVEWCAEEDNQELITNFNSQYMKIQKGWIQLEKEAQPAPKVKNKSDKLKEIWKSKKRTRKFKGATEVQKLSPVQMLFMKGFDIPNICKWFMETTETKSLVIVKKLNTRLPGDLPLMKLPLQKGCSSGIYPSSLQAERLKKHLKKFAAVTPAKNTIKIQKLWTRLRENGDRTESEQTVSPKQTPPPEVSLPQCIEPKSIQPSPSTPVQTSSRILRKYSNLRGKLHGFHRAVKQERHDSVSKHLLAESGSSNKSMCIKPLMSPKLAQQVKAIQLPTKSTLTEKGGKGRKGKGKLQEDTSAKGSLQPSKKKTPNETIRTPTPGQLGPSGKERSSFKKVSKVKQVGAPATRKQTAAGRNNKHTPQNEKSKKRMDSRPGGGKAATHAGKASAGQKASLLSKQQGLGKALKQKMGRDPPSQSLKKASSERALTRSGKRIQENKTRSKRKLRAKKEFSPSKRRRLDAK